MSYTIKFDKSNSMLIFTNPNNNKNYSINVNEFKDYRAVSNLHYYNKQYNEVIVYKPDYHRTIIVTPHSINDEGKEYFKCKQHEYDFWYITHFPNSDNANIYNLLKNELDL